MNTFSDLKENRYLQMILLIALLMVQTVNIVFWGTKKENLYWDEYFTLERAHYISDSTPFEHYIDADMDYKIEEWIPVSLVYDSLIVKREESVLMDSPYSVLVKVLGYHNYSLFLNLFEAILSPGKLSIWPAIILNIVFFLINQILLYCLCKRISDNVVFPYATVALYGFSSMCLSMAIFLRFYMLATMLTTLFIYMHLVYFQTKGKHHLKRIFLLVISFAALYIGYKNAQFMLIYGALFVFSFSLLLLIKKGLKSFLIYAVPIYGGGVLYLATQTEYLKIFTDYDKALADAGNALAWCLEQIAGFTIDMLPDRLNDMKFILGKYLFGSYYLMVALLLLTVMMIVVRRLLLKDKTIATNSDGFAIAIAISTILYLLFFTVFGLYEQVRYLSFVFTMLAVIVVIIAFDIFVNNKVKYVGMVLVLVLMICSVNLKGKVDMLYSGDRETIMRVRNLDQDSFLLHADRHRTAISYQVSLLADPQDEFYVYDGTADGAIETLESQLRSEMILVTRLGVPADDVIDFLTQKGYVVDEVGNLYNFVVYNAKNSK